jgi:transposase-like protein
MAAQKRGSAAWQSRNREKRSAHIAVGNAVSAGRLVKPSACETCAAECNPHGHHDDYSKPLVVRWLCGPCHRAWHRKYDEQSTREIVEARRAAKQAG